MSLDFQPFNPHEPVRIYHRHLPHWRQDGATYFVTARLHDSLPQHCVQYLDQLRRALLARPQDKADYIKADRAYFLKMKHYLNAGYGACWLRETEAKRALESTLAHGEEGQYGLDSYVIMPNHLHVLVNPKRGHELEEILQSWKSVSARQINRIAGRKGRVWQEESYDRLVRDAAELGRIRRYIERHHAGSGTGGGARPTKEEES